MAKNDWFTKLTEAEQQIWRLVYHHPTMIPDRTAALNLLFCTIGTGLEWGPKGEIIDTIEDNYLSAVKQQIYNLEHELYRKAWLNTMYKPGSLSEYLRVQDVAWMREYNFHLNCMAEFVLAHIEEAVIVARIPKYFYPVSQYSQLMTVPKNVKPDWLALAIETCDLILATNPLYRDSEGRLCNKANIKLARRQRAKLLKMQKSIQQAPIGEKVRK